MFTRSDRLRLFALLLWAVPLAALLPLGLWWLWQNGAMAYWLAATLAFSAAGFSLQLWLRRRDRRLLADAQTAPDPHWPPKSQAAWAAIEAMAEETDGHPPIQSLFEVVEEDAPASAPIVDDPVADAYCEYFRRQLAGIDCVDDVLLEIDSGRDGSGRD